MTFGDASSGTTAQNGSDHLPFSDVRVLDLSRLLPGGFCSLLLADFGADVIKIEDMDAGDYIRGIGPMVAGVESTATGSPFLALNRNKRSMRLDLKTTEGKAVLLRLVRDADVLVESFRPGVLDRLGVGYERLRRENPGLVYCAITGYGQDGPRAHRPGHDLNYVGLTGALALAGEEDGPPTQAALQIADIGGGAMMGAFGILTALHEQRRSGNGQLVDVSMFDGTMAWMAMPAARVLATGARLRRGHDVLAGGAVCYRPYRCRDGWVSFAALERKFWVAWCRGVGREDLVHRQYDRPGSKTHAEVEQVFATRTRDDWAAFGAEHDCCVEPVLEVEEALESELARARNMVVEFDQPGTGPIKGLGNPVKLDRTPATIRSGGPGLGEHTEEVLTEAGYSAAEIDRLLDAGAVGGLVATATHR